MSMRDGVELFGFRGVEGGVEARFRVFVGLRRRVEARVESIPHGAA